LSQDYAKISRKYSSEMLDNDEGDGQLINNKASQFTSYNISVFFSMPYPK